MYKKESQIIKELINLETSPVAVKFYTKEVDAKKEYEKTENMVMHCQAIIDASNGKSFYATKDNLGCSNGVTVLGLKDVTEEVLDGTFFDKVNVTCNKECGKTLIDTVPKMNTKIEAISYSPLENTKNADVIIVIAKPRQIFDLIRANVYMKGERIDCDVSGTQSLCGDITVNTYLTKQTKISFGCMGSHLATELQEDQVIIGIPVEILDDFVEALTIVTQPPTQ
ncbi:MAG: DUF169 domain-containing protein [Methanosphaera sp.]|nr:DUF169 domain-containing protein [Methanosphaera sp.]